ncbi:MAG: DNA-binding response regulator [Verrucomicrobia bacterium]|nr:MAG: DNA-binding response regulator [Verrucomicrobiota bacterium]
MNAVIIDDERLAREELRELLKEHSEITIVGEAANAEEAMAVIESIRPDLLFLDVQMPGADGFELLERLEPPIPKVVFTTAYAEYAVQAFNVDALDYLLKPIDPERLADSIERLHERMDGKDHPEGHPDSYLGPSDEVFVRDGDRCWFVEVSNLRLLESEGNYTRIVFEKERPLLLRALNTFEVRLDPKVFFRANRSQIINLKWIDKIEPWFSGSLRVTLKGGEHVDLSRRKAKLFRDTMSL